MRRRFTSALLCALAGCTAPDSFTAPDFHPDPVGRYGLQVYPSSLALSPFLLGRSQDQLSVTYDREPVGDESLVWEAPAGGAAEVDTHGRVRARRSGRSPVTVIHGADTLQVPVEVGLGADSVVSEIAHRGYGGRYPENTMFAFNQAFASGAEVIEMDMWMTRDSVPVIIHDPTLERTTTGAGDVRQLTFAQVREANACPAWPRVGPCPVPSLAEVLALGPSRRMLIELKGAWSADAVSSVVSMIERANMGDAVMLTSFGYGNLARVRNRNASLAVGFISVEMPSVDSLAALAPAAALVRYDSLLAHPAETSSWVATLKSRGVDVAAWTVPNLFVAADLRRLGSIHIITSVPLGVR